MTEYRTETDSIGPVEVATTDMWGAQTERSKQNFQISSRKFPAAFIKAHVELKRACALANKEFGVLDGPVADAIVQAADEVVGGQWLDMFPLDIFQTGSGTQTNMNVNEVLSNRAIQIMGGEVGSKKPVHPNDHVNKGQSSNDTIPTSMHVSALTEIHSKLLPALDTMIASLKRKELEFSSIIKIGRTHLQDAVPLTLGQEFSGYVFQLEAAREHIVSTSKQLHQLAIGGTAVGTGLNAHPQLSERVCQILSERLNIAFRSDGNKFALIGAKDAIVSVSGALRTLALSVMKIANDIRWLASGPRCGLGELELPANEPGSSIMPGKINPTQNEMLVQVGAQVIGNDAAVASGGQWSYLELNLMKPMMISNVLESITILSNGMVSFSEKALDGLKANEGRIATLVEQSLMLATALTPYVGYDTAATIAKTAFKEGKTIREILEASDYIPKDKIDEALDLSSMI
ncbi:MAG: class II fumarate hydratase [Candidatus Kariarchaeaceae archaeon]|jgi:fumarate hydratase class II